MNYSFEYIDIILLAMIAGFIFLRLRGILGRKTGFEENISTSFPHESPPKTDNKKIKSLLDNKIFDQFKNSIKDRETKGLISDTTFIGINSAEIKEHKETNNILEVTVDFVSEIISCVRNKEKKIISGDPEKIKKVHDTWKFCRDIRSNNPNWFLKETQV